MLIFLSPCIIWNSYKFFFSLFKPTKELSNIPLKAAKAYQNIIDAILAAELAAQEAERAAENADRQVCN